MRYSELSYANVDSFEVKLPLWADDVAGLGGIPVSAIDFYDDLFGNDLEVSRMPEDYQTGEYGAIAVEIVENGKNKRGKRYTITRGQPELYQLIDTSDNFCMMAAFSYAGKQRTNKNARYCFAMVIEIDDIKGSSGVEELFYSWKRENAQMPTPTYIVCSGTGLHLYFVFERPIPMYQDIFKKLAETKRIFTQLFWNSFVTNSWEKPQYESLNQGFRIVGTCCKDSKARAMAFRIGEKVSCEYLYEHIPRFLRAFLDEIPICLDEAKEKWPDWYAYRIEKKQPKVKWFRHPGIYYNWIQKIYSGAAVGHRYHCLENLCSLAVQCQIPPEEVERDCRNVAKYLESLTNTPDNHFTEYDILCALKTYYKGREAAFLRRIEYISKKTGISLTPNKRNGQKQADHLEEARAIRDIRQRRKGARWDDKNGRKPKGEAVYNWRLIHPDGRKIDCVRDTGISKPTVLKWWDWRPDDGK